jgi:ADP-ribose pyrophosphatase YjhB (NUDIX family)
VIKFCSACGSAVVHKIPPGDNRIRACCEACGTIHYENPKMVVGTITTFEQKILLCKRAIEPRYGFWTLPAGFMENGETTSQGAVRETLEEAGVQVEASDLFAVIDVPHVHQTHLFYRATAGSNALAPGEETLEARWVTPEQIPWEQLSFHTVERCLRWYLEDLARGQFQLHADAIHYRPRPTREAP